MVCLTLVAACARGSARSGGEGTDAGPLTDTPSPIDATGDAAAQAGGGTGGLPSGTGSGGGGFGPDAGDSAAGSSGGGTAGNGGSGGTNGGAAGGTNGGAAGGTNGGGATGGTHGGGLGGTQAEYCAGKGPPILLGAPGGQGPCAGNVASGVFKHAVCSCSDVRLPGYLETRSFASSTDPNLLSAGAPVGINGSYQSQSYSDVGGSLIITGSQGLSLSGYGKIGGDLEVSGPIESQGYVDVARNARLGGDVELAGLLTVGQDLVQAPGRSLSTLPFVSGTRSTANVAIDPPCACGPDQIFDVLDTVKTGLMHNDNAAVGLSQNALNNVIEIGKILELPCGRFALHNIRVLGSLTLRIQGRTALFVEDDIDLVGALTVEVANGAELDVFVGGRLLGVGYASFGDRTRPEASRVYVASDADISLTGASAFVGNLYAPKAKLRSDGDVELFGAAFAREVELQGSLRVRYDRDVLNAGDDCPPPDEPPACTDSCGTSCGSLACVAGTCAPCRSGGDCCGALVCEEDGHCGPLQP